MKEAQYDKAIEYIENIILTMKNQKFRAEKSVLNDFILNLSSVKGCILCLQKKYSVSCDNFKVFLLYIIII